MEQPDDADHLERQHQQGHPEHRLGDAGLGADPAGQQMRPQAAGSGNNRAERNREQDETEEAVKRVHQPPRFVNKRCTSQIPGASGARGRTL